ncbi:MAG TPA: sigma-70 family RNA polymerase sigma factor [Thermoanaerobaculia bacterium]|nr:sigma-70 family RNA polymerase sigma factor [Thermoanaerobaculia bacterium]
MAGERESIEPPISRESARSVPVSSDGAPRQTFDAGDSFGSSRLLLARAQEGRTSAVSRLFRRVLPSLRRWARGRLPQWARARMDTEDLVQEAAANAFRHLRRIEPRRRHALQAYLQESIRNKIRDEVRRAGRVEVPASVGSEVPGAESSPLERALSAERLARYHTAVALLPEGDQELIVGRLDLGLSYEQLALATGRPSPDAARVGVRRALLRLAQEMKSG